MNNLIRMQMCVNQKNRDIYIHENSALELMNSKLQPHYAANACIKECFLNKLIHKIRHNFCIS